jgi:hypothetical protein
MSSDTKSIYAKIVAFVSELKNVFPDEPIKLYYKLLKNTSITNTEGIEKHNQIFKDWILKNGELIKENKIQDCSEDGICFSNRVYIPIQKLAKDADKETYAALCSHLKLLLYMFEPSDELANALIQVENKNESTESDFIDNFMTKIETNFKDKEFNNPMEAMMSMFSSGVFTELVETMKDGVNNKTLDLNKLLGDVQGMVGGLNGSGAGPDLSSMLNGLGGSQQADTDASPQNGPNLSDMMGMMGSMMNMLGGNKQP